VQKREKGPARKRLEVDLRREKLLELGHDIFSKRSYDEISIDDIAAAAGVSKGLLYHYFPTKRHFYVATIKAGSDELVRLLELERPKNPIERLNHGLTTYLKYVEANAHAHIGLLRGGIGVDPEVVKIIERVRKTVLDLLLDGIGLRVDSAPPRLRLALYGWIGCAEAASLDWLENRDVTLQEVRKFLLLQLAASLSAAGIPLLSSLLRRKRA
jgi:AcrR family transcriptional regulator